MKGNIYYFKNERFNLVLQQSPFHDLYTGGTRFIRAFKKAFEILKNTLKSSTKSIASRPSMILLLTDGAPKREKQRADTLNAIKKEVWHFKHEYKETNLELLALLFGNDNLKYSVQFIKELSKVTIILLVGE